MRVHQLNCGTMSGSMPTRVLLVEAPDGLVLVDSGIGLQDIADPAGRLGPARFLLRPALDPAEAAVRRIEALGLDPRDVRHIVLTHFDMDHIGGLADFPDAAVHVTSPGLTFAVRMPRFVERRRYRRAQLAHGPRFSEYEYGTDRWEGFRVLDLGHVVEGMMFVDLPGHAVGHAGVFVPGGGGVADGGAGRGAGAGDAGPEQQDNDDDDAHTGGPTRKDLLHAGDAFYHRDQLDPAARIPASVTIPERLLALQPDALPFTHSGLGALARRRAADLDVLCAHDPSGQGGL